MKDTIYRADAIEAVKDTKPIVRSTERNWGKMIADQHSKELVKALKALPSAETPTMGEKHQLSAETPTEGSYTGFCKSQLITCNRVKECNGVCPFEDALKHADKADIEFVTQTMNEQTVIDHDRDWIIGCLEHDGFIHTHRFDKANQIIHDALSAEAVQGEWIQTVAGNGWNEWGVLKCPFCGATIEDKQYRSWEYNFCPNCRAKLEGGGSE